MQRDISQILRYSINGVVATGVHYACLVFLLEQAQVPSAGAANMMAAIVGISASFLGNRYFVFRPTQTAMGRQIVRFSLLYTLIALIHGAILFSWTDLYQFNYSTGFLVATGIQFVLSYAGNRFLVFK